MLGRLGVATARAFGWGLTRRVCVACHTVCVQWTVVKRVYVKLETVGRYCTEYMYCSTSCTQYGHAQLGVLPRCIFRGHHNLAVAFCHMGNCGHPGSELFCDAQHGSGFSLTQSRVNDLTHLREPRVERR